MPRGEPIPMYCFGCRRETEFTDTGDGEGPGCGCGHRQKSVAHGAAELCRLATWHDSAAYAETAAIARAGGVDVPDTPPYFSCEDLL